MASQSVIPASMERSAKTVSGLLAILLLLKTKLEYLNARNMAMGIVSIMDEVCLTNIEYIE